MCSLKSNRSQERGNSFSSCLLTMVIVFGGLGFYYFNYFQWRYFEAPLKGLTYVEENTAPQLNDFRKHTVAKITDATALHLDTLANIRKKTKKGTEKYPDFEQECIEFRNRLKEIMVEARLRRIPTKFQKKYDLCLLALQDAYRSVNYLEESFGAKTPAEQQKIYKESIKYANAAKKKNTEAREYFSGEGWRE